MVRQVQHGRLGDFATEHGMQVTQAVSGAGAFATAAGLAAKASWVPYVGIAVAGVTLALGLIFSRKGPQQKVATTHIVDELEPQLRQNLQGYLSGPRTRSSQWQALANFDAAWAWLASGQACGNPQMGNPGKACIEDRQRGGKWDWFSYYRDPIEHDPNVKDDAVMDAMLSIPGMDADTAQTLSKYLVPAGLVIAGLLL